MAQKGKGRSSAAQVRPERIPKRKREDVEIEKLEKSIAELEPKARLESFADLPLSSLTQAGLKKMFYKNPTEIQSRVIPPALRGRDILGASRTGSGKTLAFLIPVLENLYRERWVGPDAGLGALIVAPTRELATQIFSVLRNVGGCGHQFAAGLLTGGKSLKEEQDAVTRMNIVVGTPGRILQHLSQTAGFSLDMLRILVLDEADRILDMGFQREVDSIIEYLPPDRQTMLFSATQTRKVSDLARLSLKNPEYISVHEEAATATPESLKQSYIVTPLSNKMDMLWSFILSAKKSKMIVFFSSGKQVRFAYEAFCKMQPGISLYHLHGRKKQGARLEIMRNFSKTQHCCLFATDVAARGLDFPSVNWVVQVDCPEDVDTYIHRVGRTARYENTGQAVMFIDPSEEEGMIKKLLAKKVPIEKQNVSEKKKKSIRVELSNLCLKNADIKYLGQKAFTSYARSVFVQTDKSVFDISKLALDHYASSLGLPGAPKIKFIKGEDMKKIKNAPRQLAALEGDSDSDGTPAEAAPKKVRTKYDRMFERRNQDILADHRTDMIAGELAEDEDEDEDDFMPARRRIGIDDDNEDGGSGSDDHQSGPAIRTVALPGGEITVDSRRREKLLQSKKKLLAFQARGSRLVFDDDGTAQPAYTLRTEAEFAGEAAPEAQRAAFVAEERAKVRVADVDDKEVVKERRREKRRKAKERERAERDAARAGDDDSGSDGGEGGGWAAAGLEAHVPVLDDDDFEELRGAAASGSENESDEADRRRKKKKQRRAEPGPEPETFADLEALAAGLLG